MTIHTTQAFLLYKKQLNWPPLSVRPVLFYKICHQKIAIPTPPYLQIPLRTRRHTSNINKTATDGDNMSSAHPQIPQGAALHKAGYFPS